MTKSRKLLFLCLFLVSGFCGLVYEIVWGRLLSFVFGGTTFAVTTVLASFMGGLSAGSYLGGRLGRSVRNPARLYGFLEISIGLYCLCIPLLVKVALPLYQALADLSNESFVLLTFARVVVSVVILIVPSCVMGVTLPLLARAFTGRERDLGGSVAILYGVNTIGAFIGCVSVGCLMLPVLGLSKCIMLAAALNITAGIAAVLGARRGQGEANELVSCADVKSVEKEKLKPGPGAIGISLRYLLWFCAVSGFAAMGYQVAWIRALVLAMGASTYAFSIIVACFIFGIALGSLIISKWIGGLQRPLTLAGLLSALIGLSSLSVLPCFERMVDFVAKLAKSGSLSFVQILGTETMCVFGLLLVPTLCMGALLPLICRIYQAARIQGTSGKTDPALLSMDVGAVYAANTAGSVLGVTITGFILIPCTYFGIQRSIIFISILCGFTGSVLLLADRTWKRWPRIFVLAALWFSGILVSILPGAWSQKKMMSGPYLGRAVASQEEIVFYEEGIDCTVSVSDVGKGNRTLRINGKTDASTNPDDMCSQIMMAQIPLFLRPGSSDVCVIGLGAGFTVDSVLAHNVKSVDVAEISGSVIRAAECFRFANNDVLRNPRLALHHEDGRNFLLLGRKKYDIIISEPSNVWISGIANLYSSEFLDIALARLKPGGLYCFWIHSYSMRQEDYSSVIKTMMSRFPHVQLWSMTFGDYLVVGSESPIVVDPETISGLCGEPKVMRMLNRIGIDDPRQIAYYYVADGNQLKPVIRNQRLLIDDVPYLEFSAPRYLLQNDAQQIVEAILRVDGFPCFSGDQSSALNSGFRERIGAGRDSRNYLHESVVAANKGNGMKVLESFLAAARCAPDDRRVLSVIQRFYNEKKGNVDRVTEIYMQKFYAQISEVAPRIKESR